MSFRTRATHTVEVSDPQEYREAMDAADTLGLEIREVEVRGAWENRDDDAEPTRGSTWSIQRKTRDARKWFYLAGNGYQTFASRPVRSRVDCINNGTLELKFD